MTDAVINTSGFDPTESLNLAKKANSANDDTPLDETKPVKKATKPRTKKEPKEEVKEVKETTPATEEAPKAFDRHRILMTIAVCKVSPRFADLLKPFKETPTQLAKMSDDKLKDYLNQMRFAITSKSSYEFVDDLVDYAMQLVEKLVSNRVDITGTAASLKHKDSWRDAVEQFRIENANFFMMSPSTRMLMIAGMTAYQSAQINAAFKQAGAAIAAEEVVSD